MTDNQRRTVAGWLWWGERGLFAIGIVLAAWCAVTLVEATYFSRLPVPTASTAPHTDSPQPASPETADGTGPALPGDTGDVRTPAEPPQLAPGTLIGRLEAPSVGMAATVLEGSDDQTLARGAGHIEDTAFPGSAGNVGIAGHRDTTFRPVRNLKIGDPLVLSTSNGVFRYRISGTTIVGPDDVYVLDPTPQPTLTLVTCYPFNFIGHAPKRFIVRADLVGREATKTR